jgi:hypothetical protein
MINWKQGDMSDEQIKELMVNMFKGINGGEK